MNNLYENHFVFIAVGSDCFNLLFETKMGIKKGENRNILTLIPVKYKKKKNLYLSRLNPAKLNLIQTKLLLLGSVWLTLWHKTVKYTTERDI